MTALRLATRIIRQIHVPSAHSNASGGVSTILTILSDFVTIDDSDVIWNHVRIACQNRDQIVDSDRS